MRVYQRFNWFLKLKPSHVKNRVEDCDTTGALGVRCQGLVQHPWWLQPAAGPSRSAQDASGPTRRVPTELEESTLKHQISTAHIPCIMHGISARIRLCRKYTDS